MSIFLQDGFYKVDHDYVVNSAKTAKDAGCKHFHLVSSQGADGKSSFLYMKTKVIRTTCIFIRKKQFSGL